MGIVNGSLQEGYKDAAWFAANPTLVLLVGQKVNLQQTGNYKLGDGTTQLQNLTFLGKETLSQTLAIGNKTGALNIESDNGYSTAKILDASSSIEFDNGTNSGKFKQEATKASIDHTVAVEVNTPSFTVKNASNVTIVNDSNSAGAYAGAKSGFQVGGGIWATGFSPAYNAMTFLTTGSSNGNFIFGYGTETSPIARAYYNSVYGGWAFQVPLGDIDAAMHVRMQATGNPTDKIFFAQKHDLTDIFSVYNNGSVTKNGIEVATVNDITSFTFSTGLTNTSGTITANLSTGVVGGQSVIGGTSSGNNLTLSSTSHATKGAIMLGASSEYDEENKRLGINTITPTAQIESRFDSIGATAPTIAQSLFLSNETLATVGTQQYSPAIYWGGAGWRTIATAASQPIKFRNYLVTIAGTNATGTLTWESSLNGAAYSNIMSLTAAGALTIGGNLSCNSVLASSVLRAGSASQIYWNTRSQMFSPADGIIQLTDAAATAFNRLQLGGTTSAFPSIKRSGANIAIRLADDSADTGLTVSGINVSGETASKVATFDASKNLKSSSVSTTELINTIVECGLNVLNYGLTGNGVTDDRAALNTLLTNATTGATIYFPPGTYLIGSNIAVSNKQFNFVGSGNSSIIKISANTQILNISSTAALASKWSFSDLVFEGSGAGGNQAALYFSNNSGSFSINRCTFRSFGYAGIAVANTETSDVLGGLISSCKFYSNNIAIDCSVGTRGEYVQILNSDFYSNTKAIVTNSGNLIISNNNINFNGTGIESITGTNNGHFIINGNNINHNTSFGLNISNTTLGLTISNNHIYQSPISIVSTSGVNIIGGQIDVTAYTLTSNTGLIFSNVRFDSGYTNTITLTGTAPIYTNCFKMNGDIAVTAASFVTLASNPSATFVANTSANFIYAESTFDGFTLAQIVRQLKNRGQIS